MVHEICVESNWTCDQTTVSGILCLAVAPKSVVHQIRGHAHGCSNSGSIRGLRDVHRLSEVIVDPVGVFAVLSRCTSISTYDGVRRRNCEDYPAGSSGCPLAMPVSGAPVNFNGLRECRMAFLPEGDVAPSRILELGRLAERFSTTAGKGRCIACCSAIATSAGLLSGTLCQ